jgi:hypothetical protein
VRSRSDDPLDGALFSIYIVAHAHSLYRRPVSSVIYILRFIVSTLLRKARRMAGRLVGVHGLVKGS